MGKYRVKAYVVEFHDKLIDAKSKSEAMKILQENIDMNKFGDIDEIPIEEIESSELEQMEVDEAEDLSFPTEMHWFHEGSSGFDDLDRVSKR